MRKIVLCVLLLSLVFGPCVSWADDSYSALESFGLYTEYKTDADVLLR